MHCGCVYLVAVIDWYSRYVLSWEISNPLDAHFCVVAVEEALAITKLEIFNEIKEVNSRAIFLSTRF